MCSISEEDGETAQNQQDKLIRKRNCIPQNRINIALNQKIKSLNKEIRQNRYGKRTTYHRFTRNYKSIQTYKKVTKHTLIVERELE